MTKDLIIVINNDQDKVPLGNVMNAVGHMAIGMAPRFQQDKFPVIAIYSGNTEQVRNFRQAAYKLNQTLSNEQSVYSDFAHTTTEGSAKSHEEQTNSIKEADITYFAACICAETTELSALQDMLANERYTALPNRVIQNSEEEADFEFTAPIAYPDAAAFTDEAKKFSIALTHSSLDTASAMTAVIKATIALGVSVPTEALRLHQYPDADGSLHPGMSEFGLVVLKAKNAKRLTELTEEATSLEAMGRCGGEKPWAIAVFGATEAVNAATRRNLNLWSDKQIKVTGNVAAHSVVAGKKKPNLTHTAQKEKEELIVEEKHTLTL